MMSDASDSVCGLPSSLLHGVLLFRGAAFVQTPSSCCGRSRNVVSHVAWRVLKSKISIHIAF
eukprot:6212639-Pleurochrysis_carterae.AAC.5